MKQVLRKHVLPLPSIALTTVVGSQTIESYLRVGEVMTNIISRYLPDRARILDVACGCGRVARFLYMIPTIKSYLGFDVNTECISWCKNAFAHVQDKRFSFVLANTNTAKGKVDATIYKFPVVDGGADFVIATSIFTHLLEKECHHYFDEVARSLSKGGLAFITIHDEPAGNQKFSGNRYRADQSRDYFVEMASNRGLEVIFEMAAAQRIFIFKKG